MRKTKRHIGIFLLLWCAIALWMGVGKTQGLAKESDIKAAFVYNFTKYIEWPESKSHQKICIGFIGKTSVKHSLKKLIAKKNLENQITIKTEEVGGDILSCNILVIVDQDDLTELIAESAKENSILIITDNAKSFPKGSCINLVKMGPKFRFEISKDNMRNTQLKVSAQLLKLAISTNKK